MLYSLRLTPSLLCPSALMRNRTNGKRRRVVENLISFCTLARASSIMVCKIGFDFDGYSSAGVERMVLTFPVHRAIYTLDQVC